MAENNLENNQALEPNMQSAAQNFLSSVLAFLKNRLSIADNANPEETIAGIERDIEFKGFNIWILIVAIVIASVGLNANSTAVVIGAMLISPLMGPIMGVGLSVGINDFAMLKRSLRNLGIAVGVSIITSTIFFFFISFDVASSELLARTKPDIRDVFIALFGGLAGILAGSRKEKSNVIPGVAIATALMPPLCTAGYGLATGQLKYFLGAGYLFLINAFFIALATVIVVRYLRFPIKTFVDKATETRAKRLLVFTTIIMIVPASVVFYNLVIDTVAKRNIMLFVDENINPVYGEQIGEIKIQDSDNGYLVTMVKYGEPIAQEVILSWQKQLSAKVENAALSVLQGAEAADNTDVAHLVDMYNITNKALATKEAQISALEAQIKQFEAQQLPRELLQEIKVNYPEVAAVRMGRMVYTDFVGANAESHPNFYVLWGANLADSAIVQRTTQLEKWLSVRFQADSVVVTSLGKVAPVEVLETIE